MPAPTSHAADGGMGRAGSKEPRRQRKERYVEPLTPCASMHSEQRDRRAGAACEASHAQSPSFVADGAVVRVPLQSVQRAVRSEQRIDPTVAPPWHVCRAHAPAEGVRNPPTVHPTTPMPSGQAESERRASPPRTRDSAGHWCPLQQRSQLHALQQQLAATDVLVASVRLAETRCVQ